MLTVDLAYDPWFPRVTSRTVGAADITQYTYAPIGSLSAMRLLTDTSPLANSAITYGYDALGRVTSRNVAGSAPVAFQYDPIGRLTSRNNDLGTFTLGYLGQTGQITSRQRAGSTVATTWSYLPNSGDRRLAGINNTGYVAGHFSNFTFATTPENFISNITESSNTAVVYPAAGTQTATFNNLNQVTAASGQAFTYDANGNLLADGQRVYTWDAEDRLTGITYPGQAGKASAFSYDGLGRRVAITETPAGGGTAVTTRYLWCGSRMCQARDGANAVTRGYYAEGEFVPGGASAYYGVDQIGSVRRAFVSPSTAPAYGYDPYGVSLQTTTPLMDFGYAGMYRHGPSGLYLTWFRAYDAGTGRWLSRDPVGEESDQAGNLYAYVEGNPVSYFDPFGLQLSFEQRTRIWQTAEDWVKAGVPYRRGGTEKDGADCSGAISSTYRQAGVDIGRMLSGGFANSPLFSPVTGQPQIGDIAVYPGHVALHGGDLGQGRDVWSAFQTGGPNFGRTYSKYFGKPTLYRYTAPGTKCACGD